MGKWDDRFIIENSNRQKIKVFLVFVVCLVIILGLSIALFSTFEGFSKSGSYYTSIKELILAQVNSLTPAGIFYAGFGSSIFFVPLPEELFYWLAITKGSPLFWSALMINAGFLLAQVANYYMGKKLSKPLLYFFSKKKVYKVRRFVN